MNYTKVTCRHLKQIRRRIEVEVNKLGTDEIVIKKTQYKDDGLNGKIPIGEINALERRKVLFLNQSNGNEVIVEGGRKVTVTATLIIPWYEDCQVAINDKFEYLGKKYQVEDIVDKDGLHVYYEVSLSGIAKENNGYE